MNDQLTMRATLEQLLEVGGITTAIIASWEGFVVDGISTTPRDMPALSAAAVDASRAAGGVAELGGYGEVRMAVIETDQDYIALQPVNEDTLLILAFSEGVSLAYLRFLLGRYVPRFRQSVEAALSLTS